jgi:ABC-type amino acid transport substrate-binding protein
MKNTKWMPALIAAVILAGAQTAKTAEQAAAGTTPAKPDYSFLTGKTGTANASIFSEEELTAAMNKKLGAQIKNFVYTDSMASGLAMLKSDRADFMLTGDIAADYIIQRNPGFKSVVFSGNNGLAMILRSSDVKLRDSLNSAIRKLKASGKSAELYKKWITELPAGQEPSMPTIAKTAYKDTVYVGVSGDLPPLDYMAADGKPSGFNIAFLAEISKIAGKNIEIMSIDASARFAALQSEKIDVFFWQRLPDKSEQEKAKKLPAVQALHKNFITTAPYCTLKTVFLLKK